MQLAYQKSVSDRQLTVVALKSISPSDPQPPLALDEDFGSRLRVKFNHIGIPTTEKFEGEIDLPHLKMTVSDNQNNSYGIQWQRQWKDAPYPDLVKTVPLVAFEVDDLSMAIIGQHVIIEPNSPSPGVMVAFFEVNGAPVELLQIDRAIRKNL